MHPKNPHDEAGLPEEMKETIAAVRAALDDMAAGDTGITLEEFDRQFRAKHGLPPVGNELHD
jgi:hypothetical protein